MKRFTPSISSSSMTIEKDGVPMPLVWTLTGLPLYVPV